MSLTVGSRHGPYDVLAPVGVGAMGPTFLARDTTRDHDVLIEVLPASIASDSAWLARVQRVAAELAALDHSNIAKSHGLGSALDPIVLVTEFVQGSSLTEIIESRGAPDASDGGEGSLPRFGLDATAALSIAFQIASALEAAHGHDIIHGNLRPAAIVVPRDGVLKVGGFGFDQLKPPESAERVGEFKPLVSGALETVAYASPEQLKGGPADRQSDVWAFGVLLYEMFSGVRPYPGEGTAETMAAVLRADPEWSALPIDTPMAVRKLLRLCLDRHLTSRLDDVGIARQRLEEHLNRHVAVASPEPSAFESRQPVESAVDMADVEAVADVADVADVDSVDAADEPEEAVRTVDADHADDSVRTVDEAAEPIATETLDRALGTMPLSVGLAGDDLADEVDEIARAESLAPIPEASPELGAPEDAAVAAPSAPPLFGSYTPPIRRRLRRPRSRVTSPRRSLGLAVVALLVGAVGAALALVTLRSPQPPALTSRYVLSAAPSVPLAVADETGHDLAIGPDGTLVAYATNRDGRRHVYVRHIDELEGTLLPDAPAPETLFFSSDGSWIGFADGASAWQKISVGGGPSVELTEQRAPSRGASWGSDGIVFAEAETGLFRVPAVGGLRRMLTTPDRDAGEVGHYWPHVLPGGRALLFTIASGAQAARSTIAALDLESRTITRLIPNGRHPQYVTSGHLVYSAGGSLYAIRFDPDRLAVSGHPVLVMSKVITKSGGVADFQVSPNGTLVYAPGRLRGRRRVLTWVGPDGTEEPLRAEPRAYDSVRIAPDGRRVAVEIREPQSEIWIWDADRDMLSPLLFTPAGETNPTWTPDGSRIAFHSDRSPRGLFWVAADGGGSVESLHPSDMAALPFAWSRDGQRLVYGAGPVATGGSSSLDLNVAATAGTAGPPTTEPLIATEFDERNAAISPDGRWIAHESAESGRSEIFVRPFPDVDASRWQVSTDGGRQPVWDPDGDRIFFLAPSGSMMAVAIETSPEFAAGPPTLLFEGHYATGSGRSFDIAPDGERFLMIKEADSISTPRFDVVIVERWAQELEARVR